MSIVVIGSSRGIGLEFVKQTINCGDVLALDTYKSEELTAIESVRFVQADVTDLASIEAAAAQVSSVRLLLVVAGVLGCTQPLLSPHRDVDASSDLLNTLSINTVGPLNVVRAFHTRIAERGTVVFISSTMGSLTSATHDLNPSYSVSKAALNMLGRKLSVELASRSIRVILMSPGVVKTAMNGGEGEIEAEESVKCILQDLEKPGGSARRETMRIHRNMHFCISNTSPLFTK